MGGRPSPLDVPPNLRRTHGAAYSRAQRASSRRAASHWARFAGPEARTAGGSGSGGNAARQSSATGTPRTSQVRRATRRWPSVLRCSRSGLQARGSFSTRMDHRSTRLQPYSSTMPRRCMLYAAIRPRSSRITGNMRGSKPVKMITRQPAACSLATAGSNSAASASTSYPCRMSFPPAARLTRSGASSTARGSCSATTSRSSLPRMARLAYRNPGRCADRASATRSAQPR